MQLMMKADLKLCKICLVDRGSRGRITFERTLLAPTSN